MVNLISSTLICRPVPQVFDFISNSENDFLWQYGTLDSSMIPAKAVRGVGSFFRNIGHLFGRRNLSTFEVTEFDPNKKYGFKSISGLLTMHTLYTFEVVSGCTKLDVSTQASAIDAVQVRESALERLLKKQLRENLLLLKRLLETSDKVTGPERMGSMI